MKAFTYYEDFFKQKEFHSKEENMDSSLFLAMFLCFANHLYSIFHCDGTYNPTITRSERND